MSTETATPLAPDTTKAESVEVKEVVEVVEPEKVLYPDTKEETKPVENVVPDKYELKLAEGSLLDQSNVERIAALAKERGLTQEQAQDLLKTEEGAVLHFNQQKLQEHLNVRETWVKEIKTDKDFGGDNFNANLEIAQKVIREFGGEELMKVLDATGYGSNPDVFKFAVKIGQKLGVGGDTFVRASQPASAAPKHAHEIFLRKGRIKNGYISNKCSHTDGYCKAARSFWKDRDGRGIALSKKRNR
jgi:hypothetical protein